jgi:hypothetical protein
MLNVDTHIVRARGAMVAFAPDIAPGGVQKAGGAIQNSPMSQLL